MIATQDTIWPPAAAAGPTPEHDIKPDMSAPGVNILSLVSLRTGSSLYPGTSMAAPHVTGAAALIKQLHPDWTSAQIKSALMTTTAQPATLGANPTVARRRPSRSGCTRNDPGLTFDKPSLSFGLTVVGNTYTKTVTAKDVSGAGRHLHRVCCRQLPAALTPVVPASITVPANGTATFDVVISSRRPPALPMATST